MIVVNFENEKDTYKTASGLWQWDYGQVLRIQGLNLPPAVEIDFSLRENGGDSITRVGVTKDGVTNVVIPDSLLENGGKAIDYCIYAFVYVEDSESGQTKHRITMYVKSRPKPEAWSGSGETTAGQIMNAINQIADGKADRLEYKDNILRLLSGEKELDRVTITGGSGSGEDAREIELQKGETAIQWRYVGDPEWKNLISLEEITGPAGPAGADGQPGQDGAPGADGITPHIGDNGNWYLGETDTGKPSRGETGPAGQDGVSGADGKSAYQYAQEGGYTGTAEEFAVLVGKQIQQNKEDISKLSEDLDELKQNGVGSGTGLTDEAKTALLNCFKNVAWTVSNGQDYYNALETALNSSSGEITEPENPDVTLESISVTYTGGDVTVGTALTSLTGITVIGTYSDGSTATITGYTLSGAIAEGENTITVSYGGKTTTFVVTGVTESSGGDTDVVNLFDKDTMVTTGAYVDTNGELVNSNNSAYAIIPVTGGETYALQKGNNWELGSWGSISLRDSNMNKLYNISITNVKWSDYYQRYSVSSPFIPSTEGGAVYNTTGNMGIGIKIPTGVSYLLASIKVNGGTDISDVMMLEVGNIENGNVVVSDYVSYVGVIK